MRVLAVIPARGGSKGIPRKNIRLLAGKPLIEYAINTAMRSEYITDVCLSTDSNRIADIAGRYGIHIVWRGEDLSGDEVPLDPVVIDATEKLEQIKNAFYDIVVTLQPTSPMLNVQTLDRGIAYLIDQQWDTVISVVNKPRLFWEKRNSVFCPLYKSRMNRQVLPAQYLETGAFLITRRSCLFNGQRIGRLVSVFETSEDEGIEIRDRNDWVLAESLLQRKRIIFRVDGYRELGLGHIYNCITMAYYLMMEHEVLLVLHEQSIEGIQKVEESNLPFCVIHADHEISDIISSFHPDIWVNDCLNTDIAYIQKLKKMVERVVTIEDLGSGADVADAAINALYVETVPRQHFYTGYKYVCLREEFQIETPKKFSEKVENVIIMFGGTDPSNLNQKVYRSILNFSTKYKDIRFEFITGVGYDYQGRGVITQEDRNIFVYPNVAYVSQYMKKADLAITSQGRSIFELASMGVPSIVLSQNQRERTHRFAQMENGFINLGVGSDVEQSLIENTLDWLINTSSVRRNMHELLLQYPLRKGVERVRNIILGVGEEHEQ